MNFDIWHAGAGTPYLDQIQRSGSYVRVHGDETRAQQLIEWPTVG